MNERIKELFTLAFPPSLNDSNLVQLSAEKFAELIVLEMCNVLDKAQWDKSEDWVCADGTRIIPQIKQHFGVEQ